MRLKIKYQALDINQPGCRYIGRSIDRPLPETFWEEDCDGSPYVIGIVDTDDLPWSSVESVILEDGTHYVIMATSANAGEKWKLKITILDYYSGAELASAESDIEVDRHNQFYILFKVSGNRVEKISSGLIDPGTAPTEETGASSKAWETLGDLIPKFGEMMQSMMSMMMQMMVMMVMMQAMAHMMTSITGAII